MATTRITRNNPRAERLIFSAKEIISYSEHNGFVGQPLPSQCTSPGAWSQGHITSCTPAEYVWALFRQFTRSCIYWNRDGWRVTIHSNQWYDLKGAEL